MDYEGQTVQQLRKLASSRKISGRFEMNRAELVAALNANNTDNRINALEQRVNDLEARMSGAEVMTTPIG